MRPTHRLLPGLLTVRRDEQHLQVGVDPPGRAILTDSPRVRRLLRALHTGTAAPTDLEGRRAYDALRRAGLLTSAPARPTRGVRLDGPRHLTGAARTLLGELVAGPSAMTLVLSPGPLPRERLDDLMRDGTPHLVVSGGAEAWMLGPFVVPGRTACLRCIDAHLSERDPRRGLILEQLTRQNAPPLDPVLQSLTLSLAARDVRLFLEGDTPLSWSATYAVRRAADPVRLDWRRHPHCGCAWDDLALR